MFDEDIAPLPVRPVVTDYRQWAAEMAARVCTYLHTRVCAPPAVEPPIVEVAGALLAILPLADAVSAIAQAMATPCPPLDEYDPVASELAVFAAAVNGARRIVYAYCDDCWAARRVVLIGWQKRALAAELDPEQLEAGLTECSVVVAETALAEKRLAVFEKGLRRAVEDAEYATGRGDFGQLECLVAEVQAAGRRHSMPPTMTVECI